MLRYQIVMQSIKREMKEPPRSGSNVMLKLNQRSIIPSQWIKRDVKAQSTFYYPYLHRTLST